MDFWWNEVISKGNRKEGKKRLHIISTWGSVLHFARRYGNDRWFDHDLFFALIIPYQLKQRLRQVIPILATTKTGRRIYQIQLIASALVALFVGILQMAVYGIIWHLKGLSVFWRCESWGIASNSYWCDKLSFGTYMLLYMALILLFAIASIVIIDFIGRTIGNYMGAVAVSIPVCGVMMFLMRKIYYMLFLITNDQVLAYWELYALATWLIVMLLFYKIRSKRWKKVDLWEFLN